MRISSIKEKFRSRLLALDVNPYLLRDFYYSIVSLSYLFQRFKSIRKEKLIIGEASLRDDAITFDIRPGGDYCGNIANLSIFPDKSMETIYASHVLEHVNWLQARKALREIYRILKPKGILFVVVPDTEVLMKLMQSSETRQLAIDILFGVNRRREDWEPQHKYSYTNDTLESLLLESGFKNIKRFEPFEKDTSMMKVDDQLVSLCLCAEK